MIRKASAVWHGDLKAGRGTISSESGVLKDVPYAFVNRFENTPGTNPEELVGAAHAGCFSMAFAAALAKAGFTAESVATTANVTLENVPPAGWTVTRIHLETVAKVPGITADKFAEIANGAKVGCPISRLLKAAEITLDAKLG